MQSVIDHTEFPMLLEDDSKKVLSATIQKEGDEIKQALAQFTYFDRFDEILLKEACTVSKIKHFKCEDIILSDAGGVDHFVYFLLEGHCALIEHITVKVIDSDGKKLYQLIDNPPPENTIEEDIITKYKRMDRSTFNPEKLGSTAISDTSKLLSPNIEKPYGKTQKVSFNIEDYVLTDKRNVDESRKLTAASKIMTIEENTKEDLNDESQIQTYFMQICEYLPKSTFNLGEIMRDRRIVVTSDEATCLMIPRVWLMQHNPVNIWNRILCYLQKKIPTKQKIFKEFVKQRQWQQYRKSLVENVTKKNKKANYTSVHDVPYTIRLEEVL